MVKKTTVCEFIEKAREVHEGKYLYCVDSFTSMSDKVSIICKTHGVFRVYASNHTKGQGCGQCSGRLKMNTASFLVKARRVHGNKYDYSNTVYRGSLEKITFRCKKHDKKIVQTASKHLESRGYACPDCLREASLKKWDTEEFIRKSREVHEDKYKYDRVVYDGTYSTVEIFCKACDKYYFQTAGQHVRGSGCHSCGVLATTGANRDLYKSDQPAHLYMFKLKRGDRIFLKVGVARDIDTRANRFRYNGNTVLECLNVYQGAAREIFEIETLLHRNFTLSKLRFNDEDWSSWSGYTECYPIEMQEEIISYIEGFNNPNIKLIGD